MWASRNIARRCASTGLAAVGFCVLSGTATAAAAPSATTGAVTSVTSTTATVSGTVNPNGTSTSWYFEYGTSTSYGSKTPAANVGSGTVAQDVSANISGLTPATTYHYRFVAMSSAGTTDGLDGLLTTSPAAAATPTVVTSPATGISSTGATLNGTVNPNGSATTYYFEFGKTTSYGSKTSATGAGSGTSAVTVSAAISGLQAGQSYHFRLDATSSAGPTSLGSDQTFTAGPPTPTATTKAATSITSSGAKLNGTVNPKGQATTWYFEYGTSTSYGSQTSLENAGNGTRNTNVSATVSGLTTGTYHFRLVVTGPAGPVNGSDLTFAVTGPPVVLTGSAQGASTSAATLTGSVNPSGNSTRWWFEYGLTASYGLKTAAQSAGSGTAPTGVSAAISRLTAGTTYHYRLVASSGSGTTFGSDVTFTTVQAVSLQSSTPQLVYGSPATLSGAVATRQSGVSVAVLAQPYGSSAYSTVGTAVTGPGGTWTFKVRPRVQTVYQAKAPDGTSSTATIGVRPAISLRVITGARFTSRVVAASSFAGKTIQLQRLLPGNRWATVAKAKLNARSSAIFAATALPRGASQIRVAMSVNQAGAGYLAGFSRTISYRRT